jgi:hypothetical protein
MTQEGNERLKTHDIVYARLRLMTRNEFGEWCGMPVGKDGRDLETGGVVWVFPEAVVTAAEARAVARGGKA